MKIIDADDTRMIDLPGVGPCPRPVDIDQGVTGFHRLKSLRIYRFEPGPAIHGDSETDEVFILPLPASVAQGVVSITMSFRFLLQPAAAFLMALGLFGLSPLR